MSDNRWNEPHSRTYIGFEQEATVFTGLPMTDLDNPAAKTNFYLTDRTKEYLYPIGAVSVLNSAVVQDPSTYTLQRLGAIVRFTVALSGTPAVTMTGSFLPMYRLIGARNVANTATRAEIDTTTNGDTDMTGIQGRAKRGGTFTFIPGATFVNAAAKTVTFKNMIEAAIKGGYRVCIVTQNDYTNPLLPRDASYGFIGNTGMNRNLNQIIETPITWYQAATDDSDSYDFIDYVA